MSINWTNKLGPKPIIIKKPCFTAYAEFHAKRLAKLEAFVAKRKASMIKRGWNDCGPVEWECRWRGFKEVKGFEEHEVWEAAWEACLANSMQECKKIEMQRNEMLKMLQRIANLPGDYNLLSDPEFLIRDVKSLIEKATTQTP